MRLQPLSKLLSVAALSAALLACVQPAGVRHAMPKAALGLDVHQAAARIADPIVTDWSSRHVASAAIDAQREVAATKRDRRVQSLTVATHLSGEGFAGSQASGRISAPAFNAQTRQVYWVSENGWLLQRNIVSGTTAAFPISVVDGSTPTDTFPKTSVTLSKDGKRVYLCSAEGRFFALDALTGKNLLNSPHTLGETDAAIGFSPPPYVDELAGSADGAVESVYAVTNKGTLYRFYVDGSEAVTAPYVTKAQTYSPTALDPEWMQAHTIKERYPFAPIVVRGKAILQTRRSEVGGYGRVLVYDTQVRTATLTPDSGQIPSMFHGFTFQSYSNLDSQPPVIQLDDQLNARLFFNVHGNGLAMVDVSESDWDAAMSGWTGALVVSNALPDSGKSTHQYYGVNPMPYATAPALDLLHDRMFAVSCNALFQISMDKEAMGKNPEMYPTDTRARIDAFEHRRWYAKTALGRSMGSQDASGGGIQNVVPPYFDGTHVFVLDNFDQPDGSTRMTLNRFLPGNAAPPTLLESTDLTALAPDAALLGVPGLGIDPVSGTMLFTSRDTASPARGRLWFVGL